MLRVLVADSVSRAGLQPLAAEPGVDLILDDRIEAERLLRAIPACDALIVRSRTQVTADVIRAGSRLRVIARAGTGVDNVDLDAATESGVLVVNAPAGNSVAAAEHTIAMLMALTRNVPQADAALRAGKWERGRWIGHEVRDKTFGLIGLGRVAMEVAHIARELGMRVVATDPFIPTEWASQRGVELVELATLLQAADYISVHVPLTPANRHLLGAAELAQVKPAARILNVARGGLVDEAALLQALHEGRLAGAALDVFEQEPLPADSPLLAHPAVIVTPHLGASTQEAQDRVARDVALQIRDVFQGRQARYAVNAPIVPPRDLDFLGPYIDLATRLGRFLMQMDAHGATRVEIAAHGPVAEIDMAYLRAGAIQGLLAGVLEERVNVINAERLAAQRGMNLMERKQLQHTHRYENMLTMSVRGLDASWSVRGTVLQGVPSIVAIDDLWVEFAAAGFILLTSHMDRPGMIGRVGTVLGEADVNISFMHVGRRAPRHQAIMVIGTDEKPPPHVCRALRALEEFTWVRSLEL